jgi:hypothetical protein
MSMRRYTRMLALAALAVVVGAGSVAAATPKKGRAGKSSVSRPNRIATTDISRRIDVNQINMFVTNLGSSAFDLSAGDAGLFYPRGTNSSAVFASGMWLGATVSGETRVTVAEYSQEFGPGAMVGGTFDDPTKPEYKVYKVVRFTAPEDSAHVERVANVQAFEDELVHHSWSEYMAGAAIHGAPWRMYRLDDSSTPAAGDSVDVPGPDVVGDMMLWCVYNDANPTNHTNDAGNSTPMGIEIQQTTFAFNRQGALGLTLFIKYKLKNKGANTLEDMYISQWSDPDLGGAAGFTDDLVGCDTLPDGTGKNRSLGFVYNSTNNDGGYGSDPPALGYDFFRGPIVPGDTLGLVSFNKYINGTDPADASETYNYMQGLTIDGDPTVDPFGNTTSFTVAGDPVSPGPGHWLDTSPADRRMMLSSGPFIMAPGDSQEITVAIVIGQGSNRLSSISALRFNDEFAQDAFDKNFDLPSPPPQPQVDVTVDDGEVTLSWDSASRENYNEPGYTFEGYNIYQGSTVAGPWELVTTYDEVNNTRVIYDQVFDPETGQLIPLFPVAFGSDLGVRFTHTVATDAVRGGPLFNGTEYFFAVTAYSYNPVGLPKVLENAQAVIRAIPQKPAAGTDLASASATPVEYVQKDTLKAPATDVVSVEVVNPELVTGNTYKVIFESLVPPFFGQIGTDTATVVNSWSLVDSTTGQVKLSGQLNRRGDDDYQVVDGLRVKVTGKYFPQFQDGIYLNNVNPNRRAIQGVNFGLPGFGGGAGDAFQFFGGTINPAVDTDSFTTVELRFSSTTTQNAYRYFRQERASDGAPPPTFPATRGYTYGGFHSCNFTAWDIINNVQLDVAFVERLLTADDGTILPDASQPARTDSTWDPSEDGLGDREYLFVIRRPYSGTEKAELARDGAIIDDTLPLMWVLTANLRSATDVIDDGDAFQFVWANPAIPNDVFVFDTDALVRGNTALAAGGMNAIRAVPNPYYTRSSYELDPFNRVIRFMNLPEVCTVRIFNLAGQLVRRLEKTDPNTSILNWNVLTENGLPVGSGVYIFHVQAPGAGEYRSKLVVFMERERLNSY